MYHERVSQPPSLDRNHPPLHSWSRAEFVERANRRAATCGWQPITDQTLLEWKKAGLLPKVGSRSLGRGKGTEGLWGRTAYRQLLRVMQLRASGLRRQRDLRLTLWMEGYEVPWRRVRSDLQALLGPTISQANRDLGAARWPVVPGEPPSNRAIKTIERRLVGPAALPGLLKEFGLPDLLADGLTKWSQRPEVKGVLMHFTYLLFSPDQRGLQSALKSAMAVLPGWLQPLVLPDEGPFDMFAGVLMPIRTGENRAWAAARKGDERLITNVRDFARNFDGLWNAVLRAGAITLRDPPTDWPKWSGPLIAGAMASLAELRPLRTTDNKVALAALLLNRRRNLEDHAEPLGVMGRTFPELFNWAADHPEMIQLAKDDPKGAEAVALAAALSPETKALLRGELTASTLAGRSAGVIAPQ